MKRSLALFCLCLFAAFAVSAGEPPFPVRPIQVVVPYSAGGGTDLSVRILAETIKQHLPRGMVVVNKPGGGGSIGTSSVAHARPDGYTLGTGSQGPLCLLPHYGGTDYSKDDFEFIGLLGRNLMCVAVGKDSPVQSFEEFMDYAKANPGALTVSNSGAGGANHLMIEGFAQAAGIEIKSMPFQGGANAITAGIGGHVDVVTGHPSELVNHVKSGSLKVIFVVDSKRIKEFPDAPTAMEKGVDFEWASWKGIIGPKNMPENVKKILVDAVAKAMQDPELIKKMDDMGEAVDYMGPEEYKALCETDSAKAEAVIRKLGMYGMNAAQ